MASEFVITSENNQQKFGDSVFKGKATTYSFDFSPWAEQNNNVSTLTWTVESGNATISGKTLASNVGTALVTCSDIGRVLIKLVADSGTEIYVTALEIEVKDVTTPIDGTDYWN